MFIKIKSILSLFLTISIVSTFLTTQSFSSECEDEDNSIGSAQSKSLANEGMTMSYRQLLQQNVNHNKQYMEQFDSISEDAIADDHYLTIVAAVILPNYRTCRKYAEVANSPKRDIRFADGDEVACMNSNNLMLEIIEEVQQKKHGNDTWEYLREVGFDWKK